MKVRLAFAVAAHLEPEILIVDEVLAVGDAEFQKKCMGKMQDVARGGRTVLFVSHNMAAVEALCSAAIVLKQGQAGQPMPVNDAIAAYMAATQPAPASIVDLRSHSGRTSRSIPLMETLALTTKGTDYPIQAVPMGEGLSLMVRYSGVQSPLSPVLGVVIKTRLGMAVFGVNNRFIPGFRFRKTGTAGSICCDFDALPLMPGQYGIDLYFGDWEHDLDIILDAVSFEVVPADVYGTGKLPPPAAGIAFWDAKFRLEPK